MITKICKTCGREYDQLMNFCTKCGIELIKKPNECSEMKTVLCKTAELKDDDIYCPYCGAPTTYAKELLEEKNSW